jgi:leucyl/phenylalanyl-tRNA--protein transferase
MILHLYPKGVFPMSIDGVIEWYGVRHRALFPIEGIRLSKSMQKRLRKADFEVTFDQAYSSVIEGCADREDTWLSDELMDCFNELHRIGIGHSCEVWMDGKLVGGIYGLAFGAWFSAESMFHRRTDTSKIALHYMVQECRKQGFTIFDAQVMNPHLRSLGAFEVQLDAFLQLARHARAQATPWGEAAIKEYLSTED